MRSEGLPELDSFGPVYKMTALELNSSLGTSTIERYHGQTLNKNPSLSASEKKIICIMKFPFRTVTTLLSLVINILQYMRVVYRLETKQRTQSVPINVRIYVG